MATVPTTLGTAALPLSTVRPYPFHCGVPPHSEKGMGEVNQHHYLLSSPTIDRMISSTTDPTPMTGSVTLYKATMLAAIPQGQDGQASTGSGL